MCKKQKAKKSEDGIFKPIPTEIPAAPSIVLQFVKCWCKTKCSTLKCSCRTNGIECSAACSGCKGVNCTNSTKAIEEDSSEEEAL